MGPISALLSCAESGYWDEIGYIYVDSRSSVRSDCEVPVGKRQNMADAPEGAVSETQDAVCD